MSSLKSLMCLWFLVLVILSSDIKKFISQVAENNIDGAYETIRKTSPFASICGRVCPAEYNCRKMCLPAAAVGGPLVRLLWHP